MDWTLKSIVYLLLIVVMVLIVESQDAGEHHKFASKDEIHDSEHIKQHLESKINVEKLTEQKQRFHYFKLHDLNRDGTLDGLEIIKALTHDHISDDPSKKPRPVMADTELENLVDSVLKDMDLNLDGKIDFSEYLRKQQA